MKRRIVFLINSLTGGGAERVMTTILRASSHQLAAWDVHLVLLDDEPMRYPVPAGVTLHQLDARYSLPMSLLQLGPLLKRLRPDICLSFLTRSNICNVLMQALAGHRAIISERANTSARHNHDGGGRLVRSLIRFTYPRARRIIAVSQGVADDLTSHFGVPVDLTISIPNPIDIETIVSRGAHDAPSPFGERPFIVAMARLVESKNMALLVDAFHASRFSGGLLVLGEGPLRSALEAQIERLGLGDRVRMPGFADNPFALIRQARAFVLPSNSEGFPNGLAEAMCLGVPVVSTNCASGPAEILAEDARLTVSDMHIAPHGVLVPPNNADALARGIDWVLEPDNRDRMAIAARSRAEAFSVSAAVERYWSVIEGVHQAGSG